MKQNTGAKRILVVGGGVSALEVAGGICDNSNRVEDIYLSYRGAIFVEKYNHPSKTLRETLDKCIHNGRLKIYTSSVVNIINKTHVNLIQDRTGKRYHNVWLKVDRVITAIGYSLNTTFFKNTIGIDVNETDPEFKVVNKDDNEESISKSCNIHETSLKNMFLFFGDGKAAKLNDVEEEDTKLFFPGCLHLKDKLNKLSFDTKLDENTLVAAELAIEIGTRMCETEK